MANTIASVTSKIGVFKAIIERDSITPVVVGSLLDDIVSLIRNGDADLAARIDALLGPGSADILAKYADLIALLEVLNTFVDAGSIDLFKLLVCYMEIKEVDGKDGIFLGQTITLRAKLGRPGYDMKAKLGDDYQNITWKVERTSSNPAKDALWNADSNGAGKLIWPVPSTDADGLPIDLYDECRISLKWSPSDADDDFNYGTDNAVKFTFTATVPSVDPVSATIVV